MNREKPYIRSIKRADNGGFVIETCKPQTKGKDGIYPPSVDEVLTAADEGELAEIVVSFFGGKSESDEAAEMSDEELVDELEKDPKKWGRIAGKPAKNKGWRGAY